MAYTTREGAIRAGAAKSVAYDTKVDRKDCTRVLRTLQAAADGKPVAQPAKDATVPGSVDNPQPGDGIRIDTDRGIGKRTYRVTGRSDDGTLRVQPLTTYAPNAVWGKERLPSAGTIDMGVAMLGLAGLAAGFALLGSRATPRSRRDPLR